MTTHKDFIAKCLTSEGISFIGTVYKSQGYNKLYPMLDEFDLSRLTYDRSVNKIKNKSDIVFDTLDGTSTLELKGSEITEYKGFYIVDCNWCIMIYRLLK